MPSNTVMKPRIEVILTKNKLFTIAQDVLSEADQAPWTRESLEIGNEEEEGKAWSATSSQRTCMSTKTLLIAAIGDLPVIPCDNPG